MNSVLLSENRRFPRHFRLPLMRELSAQLTEGETPEHCKKGGAEPLPYKFLSGGRGFICPHIREILFLLCRTSLFFAAVVYCIL